MSILSVLFKTHLWYGQQNEWKWMVSIQLSQFVVSVVKPGVLTCWSIWGSMMLIPISELAHWWRREWCFTETEMLPYRWNFHHWLHWKLPKWQLLVQPVMKVLSKWWHFCFNVCCLISARPLHETMLIYCLIIHWTLRNQLQGNLNQNTKIHFNKMHLKIQYAKCLSSCPTAKELNQ